MSFTCGNSELLKKINLIEIKAEKNISLESTCFDCSGSDIG